MLAAETLVVAGDFKQLPGASAFRVGFSWVADSLIFKGPCLDQTLFRISQLTQIEFSHV
jgi:hypothetical protein